LTTFVSFQRRFSAIAVRATGETDINPVGAMGAVTQIFYGAVHPGVETTEAYEKGRLYNQTIALAEDGKALGWQVSMDIKDAENGDKYFIVSALDKQNNPLKNMEITGIAIRPVSDGSDIRLDFQELGQGRYGAAATLPYPGQWEVDLMISGPDQSKAQHNQRIFIK